MADRRYFSTRTGSNPDAVNFDLTTLRRYLKGLYSDLVSRYYFQEAFGYYCVDAGEVCGTLGSDVETRVALALRKQDLWPVEDNIEHYSEDDCFDVIEFLHDHVSKPIDGWYHSYCSCGWHYSEFSKEEGRQEFRAQVNLILRDFQDGWELSEGGEILALGDDGMQALLDASFPEYDPRNVEDRVAAAVRKYRIRGATSDDRRDAVRDLADVLEFLRPKAGKYLLAKKDEGALFQIANEFAIRHHNAQQKSDYNTAIWHSWMFYFYLATIHAAVRVIKENEATAANSDPAEARLYSPSAS